MCQRGEVTQTQQAALLTNRSSEQQQSDSHQQLVQRQLLKRESERSKGVKVSKFSLPEAYEKRKAEVSYWLTAW